MLEGNASLTSQIHSHKARSTIFQSHVTGSEEINNFVMYDLYLLNIMFISASSTTTALNTTVTYIYRSYIDHCYLYYIDCCYISYKACIKDRCFRHNETIVTSKTHPGYHFTSFPCNFAIAAEIWAMSLAWCNNDKGKTLDKI